MKLLLILFPFILFAEDKAVPYFQEETLNWRLNSSQNKIDYSSRLRFFRYENFSSGMIIRYKFDLTPSTKMSDIEQTNPDSLIYINYKF